MKKIMNFAALAAALLAAAPVSAQQALSADVKEQIRDVQGAIKEKGANWVAGETNVSSDRANWQNLVGLNFEPVEAEPVEMAEAAELPAALDWRDNKGNFVTKPKNQKNCGSCWAFSMTGGLESYSLLRLNKPGYDLDLSEQVMLSCSGAGSCNGGRLTATFLQRTGLPLDSAYPYVSANGSCATAAAGWQNSTYKIGAWGSVSQSLTSMKTALVKYGPLPTAMMVYEDFMHYKSGVYSYTTGKKLGGHAVLLVGYNDEGQYFIVKNSWDTGWGEGGFFRIAYSEMESDVNFGLSTIAYRPAKGELPAGEAAMLRADPWNRVAAMFEGIAAWN